MTDDKAATSERREEPSPKGILWIASYPKSGNTWTRNFLHNLLKILEADDAKPQDINGMNEFTAWEIAARHYEKILGKHPKDCERDEIARVRPQVQKQIADHTDGLAMIKTHHAIVMDRGVPTINFAVTSGAIYIVRNPLDVAISFAAHLNTTIDQAIDEMATEGLETLVNDRSVYEVYGSWSQHVESWTRKPHRTVYVMRYEDMLADPVRSFGGLSRHLLLDPTKAQLLAAIERSSFQTLQRQEAESGFLEKPEHAKQFFREGKAGQWHDTLSRRQVRVIVADHREQMREFGYLTLGLEHLC